jgi:hypothetical protein
MVVPLEGRRGNRCRQGALAAEAIPHERNSSATSGDISPAADSSLFDEPKTLVGCRSFGSSNRMQN